MQSIKNSKIKTNDLEKIKCKTSIIETKFTNVNSFNKEEQIFDSLFFEKSLNKSKIDKNEMINYLIKKNFKKIRELKPEDFCENIFLEYQKINNDLKESNLTLSFSSNIIINEKEELLTNVNNIYDFNNNLLKVQLLKIEDLCLFKKEKKSYIWNQIKNKVFTKSYYPNLQSKVNFNIKNIVIDIEKPNNKKKAKFLLKKINTRYIKSKEDVEYLEKYYMKNKFKWSSETINRICKKWCLSKYTVYRWNYDKLNKRSSKKLN